MNKYVSQEKLTVKMRQFVSKWKKLLLALIFIIVGSVASYRIGEIVVTRIFPHKTKTPSHTLTENPEYLTIELKDSVHSIDALGQIVYGEKVNISSKVEGRLEKIYVREGSRVTKGQLLAEIERLTLELTLKQQQSELDISQKSFELAKAKLENAIKAIEIKLAQIRKARADVHDKKITYENSLRTLTNKTELFTIGGISESELEAIKTQHTTHHTRYLNAKADLEIQEVGFRDTDIAAAGFEIPNSEEAKIELFKTINTKIEKAEVDAALSKINQVTQIIESTKKLIQETYIRAPISGIVALKNMEVGEIVKRDSIIATVIDISSVFLSLNVGETEVKHIREGQNVLFTADAFHNEEFRGKIARIVPVLDSKTRTFEIKALVPNSDMRLLPGMFARAKIIIEKKENAILIPAHALITRSENEGEILLVKKQIPFRHKIKLGKEFGDHVEVIEGLSRGDVIVSKQARALLQGAIAEK